MDRTPVVAGQFYPAQADELMTMIADCTPTVIADRDAFGVLVPHAGYVYSGPTAGATLARIRIPETIVLLTPSHRYTTPACALWTGGAWETPLGKVAVHEQVTDGLAQLPMVTTDDRPHMSEHSGEVILPFIQYHRSDARIAVICITSSVREMQLLELGSGIADVLDRCGEKDALVVTSSDMSHEQGSDALRTVHAQDPLAIAKMQEMNPSGLLKVCRERHITMCGALPAAAMMASVHARGKTEVELIRHATSADSSFGRGDYVVGYAGIVFYALEEAGAAAPL